MTRATDTGAAVSLAVVLTWCWSIWFPDLPMPEAVAAAIGAIIGPIVDDVRRIRRRLVGGWLDGDRPEDKADP